MTRSHLSAPCWVACAGLLAGFFLNLSPTPQGTTLSIGPGDANAKFLRRVFRRIGQAVTRVTRRIAQGVRTVARRVARVARRVVQTVGNAAKAAFNKVKELTQKIGGLVEKAKRLGTKIARTVADTAKKVAQKAKEFATKAFNAAKNLAKKVKDKLLNAMKSFGSKAMNFIKDKAKALLLTVIQSFTKKIGYTAADVKRIVDLKTGAVSRQKVREVVTERLMQMHVRPMIQDKIAMLITQALDFLQQFINPAVSAALGAVGSIPIVGGLISGALHLAYTQGMTFLKSFLAKQLTNLLMLKLINPLVNKGVQALYKLGGGIKKALDVLFDRAYEFFEHWIKLPSQRVGRPERPFDPRKGV